MRCSHDVWRYLAALAGPHGTLVASLSMKELRYRRQLLTDNTSSQRRLTQNYDLIDRPKGDRAVSKPRQRLTGHQFNYEGHPLLVTKTSTLVYGRFSLFFPHRPLLRESQTAEDHQVSLEPVSRRSTGASKAGTAAPWDSRLRASAK